MKRRGGVAAFRRGELALSSNICVDAQRLQIKIENRARSGSFSRRLRFSNSSAMNVKSDDDSS